MTRADIAKYIPYHNRLFHDSAAAGYAEVWDRNDLDDAFYLSLSNSVGGAVIVANKIFEGLFGVFSNIVKLDIALFSIKTPIKAKT